MPDWECAGCGTQQKNQRKQPTCYVCQNPMTVKAAAAAAQVTVLKWTNHKNKHVFPKGAAVKNLKSVIAGTKHEEARYAQGLAIQAIETRCLVALGNVSGIVETNGQVGWFNEEDCTMIQIYVGGDNSFHGHPISDDMAANRGGVTATRDG